MRLTLDRGDTIAAVVRGAIGESLVVVMPATLDPLAMAQARAAIGPLAMELAPATRLNAVVMMQGADPDHVDAAVDFLDGALSTTGQLIEIHASRP